MNGLNAFLEPLTDPVAIDANVGMSCDVVWPLPLERTVSYGAGAAAAPAAIVRAGAELERFDEELGRPIDWNVGVLPPVDCRGLTLRESLSVIETAANRWFRKYPFVVSLGGEHTVTIPLVRAAALVFGHIGVLHIDAHADLRRQYMGQSLSHACVMHHVRAVTKETVSVAVRSLSAAEAGRIEEQRIPVIWARDIDAAPCDDAWIEQALDCLPEQVYVTIDVDAFDASVFPGTGTPEPGGLSWQRGLGLLRRVAEKRRVVAADIVEAIPVPGTPVTEYAAARLAMKLMVYRRRLS